MRGPRRHVATAWRGRSYRGPRAGRRDMRVAREPERPCRFHRRFRLGNRNINSPEPTAARPGRWEQIGRTRWYRQTKAMKCGETDGRESERPIVALRRGNWTDGPRGAKGAPFQGTVGGIHVGCPETRVRVNVTTTDSGTRTREAGVGIY